MRAREQESFNTEDGVSDWIRFEDGPTSASGKTRTWMVTTKEGGYLGWVKWFGPWRRYAFFPGEGTIYEQDCLRTIAKFCEQNTRGRVSVAG
jgi:hypothetical protein